jgi:pimeloyl-ACP methyl ester carboxylesterase
MKKIYFNGNSIAYRDEGKGDTLVLVHGFCEDSRMWDDFAERLKGYRLVRVDLPGFGQSDVEVPCSIAQMAECVHALANELEIERFVLVGHSMGGYVSLAFAERWPHLLLGLGLFHSHPYADGEEQKLNRQKGIDFIRNHGHILYVKQLIPRLFPSSFNGEFAINQLIHQAAQGPAAGISNALMAMMQRPDRSLVLAEAACPVLCIIGELDSAVPLDASLAMCHLPRIVQIELLPKVGHMGMFERPSDTAKMLMKFMALCDEMRQANRADQS